MYMYQNAIKKLIIIYSYYLLIKTRHNEYEKEWGTGELEGVGSDNGVNRVFMYELFKI